MQIILITGISGAGKSVAIKCLEDLDYYCIDNIPPILIPKFVDLCIHTKEDINKVAMVSDLREISFFQPLEETIQQLKSTQNNCSILFLDADDDVLITRYKQSRRKHPLVDEIGLQEAIEKEKQLLRKIKDQSDYIINTSEKSESQLKKEIYSIFGQDEYQKKMVISVMSFGFKYGLPLDADLVFDVRFLPNPFYIQELKEHTGLETCVSDYVLQFNESGIFIDQIVNMLNFLIPNYLKEGKLHLTIAIGCTGGKHRSVTIAENLFHYFKGKNQNIMVTHRDIQKNKR